MLPKSDTDSVNQLSTKSVILAVLFEMATTVFSNIFISIKDLYLWASMENINGWLDNISKHLPLFGRSFMQKHGLSERLFAAFSALYLFSISFCMREGYRFLMIAPALRTIRCLESERPVDEAKNLLCLWLIFASTVISETCIYPMLLVFPTYFWLRYFFFLYLINGIDTLYFAYENLFKRLAVNRVEFLNKDKKY